VFIKVIGDSLEFSYLPHSLSGSGGSIFSHMAGVVKAVFDFDSDTKLARLKCVHPGVSLEWVIEKTGYTHDWVPETVLGTPLPTEDELRVVREVIDPEAKLLPR
jgi:hypothetical protein